MRDNRLFLPLFLLLASGAGCASLALPLDVLCEEDEQVSGHSCVPCPEGTVNAAGDNSSGSDSSCDPWLCADNERVDGHTCIACPPGMANDSGDDASGEDSSCDVVLCDENQQVAGHQCEPCPAGTTSTGGDDASAEDTACDPCAAGSYDIGTNLCLPCDPGWVSAPGAVTCLACPAESYELDNVCVDCAEGLTSLPGAIECGVSGVDHLLSVRDYGYLFWPGNHWTTWGTFHNEQYVQTGYYGLALNVASGSLDHFGLIDDEFNAETAARQDNQVITNLSGAEVRYLVTENGNERLATEFADVEGSTNNPSRLIDMGRFMQRVDIPQVSYAGSTDLSGSVQLAAMTRHFVLTHRVASESGASSMTVSIEIQGDAVAQYSEVQWLDGSRALSLRDTAGEGWSFIIPERAGATSAISIASDGSLSFESSFEGLSATEEAVLSVIAVPSNAGGDDQLSLWLHPTEAVSVEFAQLNRDGNAAEPLTEAQWDPERGLYVVALRNLSEVGAPGWQDWADANIHNWYNRHRFVITNNGSSPVSVPIAFDGGNNAAFYIVGGSPLLRDAAGEPVGAPVQISKNWHEQPFWYHLYSALELAPGVHEFEHTFAHSKWGEAYAAAHAQLSLVGWGQNQQWDESSLGAFGESITYDPDLTLGRAMVDDVRPFLVNAGSQWGWTGNVGGANFLLYSNEDTDNRPEHQLGRLRTHYAYTGPNLTNVVYSGISRDGKIEASISTQLGRTDDLVRAYYHLRYTFLDEVSYDRLALFQLAADRYGDNGFARYAYGDESAVTLDADVPDHETTGYEAESERGIALPGDAPWVMLYDNQRTDGNLPENLANIGFVVRAYEATIGGVATSTPHINIIRTNNGGWSQMSFELGIPYDSSSLVVPAGSVLTATVEYLVPPADKSAYYGASDYLLDMPAASYQSTDMMLELADGNRLEISPTVGAVTRTHPVELQASAGPIAVQFMMTGGLGYTPVTIRGLARPDGWRLEKQADGLWQPLSQEVEGNDYWQAYDDVAAGGFDLVFNLHNRGTHEYRLIR